MLPPSHFGWGGSVVGAGGSVPRPVASCEWFLTCSSWRALRAFARPTDMGLSLHSPDHQQICLVGMLVIGCLCGSTLLWVAKSSLDGYLLARLTLFCRLGSRNVGGILVLLRGRMPCYSHLDFCRLSRMLCPIVSSAGLCPTDFGRSLAWIIALALDCQI